MKKKRSSKANPNGGAVEPAPNRAPEWCHWLLLCVAILPFCWRQITTSDCWWHIALGRWLVEHRSLPDYSQLYFTPTNSHVSDLRWSAGGDLLLYLTHAIGGPIALQALSFLCLLLGCVLLRKLHRGPMNGWMTALLAAVAIGTYQLQLPRNALFSLPLTALVFWLFARFRETRRCRLAWLLPVVAGLWSLVHGSALLGCVLVALLLAVDVLEGMREGRTEVWRRLRIGALIAAVTLAVVVIGNPAAVRMLRKPVDTVFKARPTPRPAVAGKNQPGVAAAKPNPPSARPRNAKEWLNSLIWPLTPGQVRSADFSSPLDRLDYRPVGVAFALMALGGVWALWAKNPPFPWIATYAATAVLGLSYFRMTGYAALGSAALILSSGPLRGRVAEALRQSSWMGAALTGILAAVFWGAALSGSMARVAGNSRHVAGFGKVPTFDDEATRWLLDHHRDARVFTTIMTGSYALHQWEGRKKVFIDGFFAPHAGTVWKDYLLARRQPERDVLRERHGIDYALVEHTRHDWNGVFLSKPDWQPAAIGKGCIVYAHVSVLGEAAPELLFPPASAGGLPPYFRHALARNYYGALLSMLAANRTEAARELVDTAPEAYADWRRSLSTEEKEAVRQMDPVLTRSNDME